MLLPCSRRFPSPTGPQAHMNTARSATRLLPSTVTFDQSPTIIDENIQAWPLRPSRNDFRHQRIAAAMDVTGIALCFPDGLRYTHQSEHSDQPSHPGNFGRFRACREPYAACEFGARRFNHFFRHRVRTGIDFRDRLGCRQRTGPGGPAAP